MKLSAQRFVSVTALLCIYTLVALQNFSLLTLAQEPAPFEISLTPQADQAISGQVLTYRVTVTNTSQTSISEVFVKVKIPTGTTFVDTYYTNPKWFGGNPYPGTTVEEIFWFTPESIAPGEVITFELMVNVLPEFVEQQLTNEGYSVTRVEGGSESTIASGPPVTTQIVQVTPTSVPTVIPTAMPSSTSTLVPTPTPQPAVEVAETTPTTAPTIVSQPDSSATTEAAEPVVTLASEKVTVAPQPSSMLFIVAGLSLVVIIAIGLTWFLKHR